MLLRGLALRCAGAIAAKARDTVAMSVDFMHVLPMVSWFSPPRLRSMRTGRLRQPLSGGVARLGHGTGRIEMRRLVTSTSLREGAIRLVPTVHVQAEEIADPFYLLV